MNSDYNEKVKEMKKLAANIRINTLKSLTNLGFGHYGGSLSIVEILAVLYGGIMNIDAKNPHWEDRDYFVLSKGYAGPALYTTLALKGFFPLEEIYTLNQNGTNLPSHPDRLKTKGIDATTGSLGQGISIATGIAKALQIDKKNNRVFCIIGDGEINEGQCWEAFQFIAHHNLNNLTVFLDYNKKQLDGALKPLFVILDTIKGQGVEYIEKLKNSHHLRLTDELKREIEKAIKDLESEVE